MRDNLRRYRAIRDALTQWYPGDSKGVRVQSLVN
jgi:hypothetical protein